MEVEEETTPNHLEESIAAETTVINESLLEITTSSTDKESEKELAKLIPKSNAREEEDSSVSVPKSEDSEAFVVETVMEKEEDENGEEVFVDCRNLESAAALSGRIENSVVVESTNVVENSKYGDEDAVKEIDVPRDDVAAVECVGSELTCSVNLDGGGGKEAVVEPNGEPEVVEEKVANNGEDANVGEFSVIEKYENEGDGMVGKEGKREDEKETVKEEDGAVVLKDGEGGNVLLFPVAHNGEGDEATDQFKKEGSVSVQLEDVENVQGMAGSDVRNDGVPDVQLENIDDVQGDEAMTEERVVAGAVKEEGMVADEEEAVGVREDFKEEALMANEETVDGVAENDEEETMVEDVEKSVNTEMETETSLDTEMENEKSLCTEMETEKSLDTEMETEKSLETEMETEEEANLADEEKVQEAEIETEPELPESSKKGSGGKRKRGGKISKTTPKASTAPRKTIEEDVCFICFDGGDLVLCDRRNCPKAYHPSCVNRDDAFFQSKGRWNCGWHLCSICEKKAEYMCYTCTYSLCKACTKTSVILCVREKEKKGLCEACMRTVMLIEKVESQENVNFDDKNSWEHLFKDYWIDTKAKHNLSLAELAQAKNPWKGSGKQESPIVQSDIKDDGGLGPDNPSENLKARKNRRKAKKQKSDAKEEDSSTGAAAVGSEGSVPDNTEWVSKELLEFVTHMRNGDSSVISQFDVQDLLLEYIKRNKLRDPNRKSQIICDARLESLFGKPRVAHFEMLKLLESHFLMKEDSQIDDIQGTVVDTEVSHVDDDETNETLAKDHKDRKRRGRKKGDRRGPQSNREDYAAIDIHNISMIYLRRKLVEDLLDDMERFHEKIVGTFVRIRISGANHKQDIYRLVQVTGTSEAAQYTIGKRTTCTMLEILNLDKTETISIESISNQEFTEDECKRLRQSIKCGLISRLTVGDILDKAMELQVARVSDWLETEVVRLNHLCDRASDLGRKKELRECVEKLHVLKTPEERARRLEEFPLIHDDPTMDPDYGSEDDTDSDDKKQELYKRSDSFRLNRRGSDQFSPRGDYTSKESWSGTPRSSGRNYEFSRNMSNKNFSTKVENATSSFETHSENSRAQGRDTFVQQPSILEKPNYATDDVSSPIETAIAAEPAPKVNETEKMWHYKDPSGKIQGPFSMVQLRRWSKNGYFPVGLRIWRKSDKEDDDIPLTDALEGKFMLAEQRRPSQDGQHLNLNRSHGAQSSQINSAPGQSELRNWSSVENPKRSPDSKRDIASLPSPTPNKSTTGWTGGQASYPSGNEGPRSPTPNSVHLAGSSVSSSVACASKDTNAVGSVGVSTFPSHNSSSAVSLAVAPHNTEHGIVVCSQNPIQSSHLGQLVAAPPDSNMPPQMVQSVSSQNSQGWSSAPQNLQPNPSMNMAGLQQLAYNQWTGVPNMVQNPVGNFLPQPVAVPQEPWGQLPFPVNQPNMQPPPQPLQPNVSWGTMAANPNVGWVGPNPMNWGPMVQGPQVTGNVNPTWVMQAGHHAGSVGPVPGNVQAGWIPPPVQGVLPNQSWVSTPIQGSGNGNPSWVGAPGNQGAPNDGWGAPTATQAPTNTNNTGWVGGPGNQGAPIVNQGPGRNMGWVGNQGAPPPGNTNQSQNHANWGGKEQQHNRGSFSGQRRNRGSGFRGNRRHFNKQESFHKDGGSFHGVGRSGDSGRSSDQ